MRRFNAKTAKVLGLALLGSAVLNVSAVYADPMNISATVNQTCELGTLTDVAFGTLTPGSGTDVPATSTVQWRCTDGTNADIAINDGGNGDRSMNGPGVDTLPYQLYKEVALANVWGDSGTAQVNVNGSGMSAFATETVYGEVLHADYVDVEQGSYADIVDVTITIN